MPSGSHKSCLNSKLSLIVWRGREQAVRNLTQDRAASVLHDQNLGSQPGAVTRACGLSGHAGPPSQKRLVLGLMLCFFCLEILSSFWTGACVFAFHWSPHVTPWP